MISTEKIKEIKSKVANGYPAGELKEELKNEGYSEEDINACFTTHKYDMRSWYLFFGLAAVLTGLYYMSLHLILFGGGLFGAYVYEARRQKKKR